MVRRRGKSQSLLPSRQLAPGAAPPGFVVNPVDFDGVNDALTRASDFSGNADSKVGIFSVWFRVDFDSPATVYIMASDGTRFKCRRQSGSEKIVIGLENAAGTDVLEMLTVSTFGVSATWFNLLGSWDLAVPTANMFVNDAMDVTFPAGPNNDTIDWTRPDWAVGSVGAGVQRWNGCLAELYLNTAEFLDMSVVANRRKFISAGIAPVDLGSDGSTPTGTAPLVYLRDPAATWEQNQGGGGDLVVTGSLVACSTSP